MNISKLMGGVVGSIKTNSNTTNKYKKKAKTAKYDAYAKKQKDLIEKNKKAGLWG